MEQSWLTALVSEQHVLRVRNSRVTLFHPLLAAEIIRRAAPGAAGADFSPRSTFINGAALEYALNKVLFFYFSWLPHAQIIELMKNLFVIRLTEGAGFTPLVLYLSEVGFNNEQLMGLCQRTGLRFLRSNTDVDTNRIAELEDRLLLVQPRYEALKSKDGKWLDYSSLYV